MKKLLLIAIAAIATVAVTAPAHSAPSVVVILAGGEEADTISIAISAEDGHSFVIDAAAPLEVGGGVCAHPQDMVNELVCDSTKIGGFEVNAAGGDDRVTIGRLVGVPVTLRGGPGNDHLIGGSSVLGDKLIGGPGNDQLVGRAGPDLLFGGPNDDALLGGQDDDKLIGGPGDDTLRGEGGEDVLLGGPGENVLVP